MKNKIRYLGIEVNIAEDIEVEINRKYLGSNFWYPKTCSRLRIERYINNNSHNVRIYKHRIKILKEDF